MPALPDQAKELLDAPTFVTLAVASADGQPQATPHWVARDGDELLLSSVRGRKHERLLRENPRASVVAVNPENPYSYLEVRGSVQLSEEGGRDLINRLAKKYRDVDEYTWDGPDDVRVVIRLTPEHVVLH